MRNTLDGHYEEDEMRFEKPISEMCKIATEKEIQWYENILYPFQDKILSYAKQYKELYLTGGTCLARMYYDHRLSDDLDLFINVQKTDSEDVINSIKRADVYANDLMGLLSRNYEVSEPFLEPMYSRFFIQIPDTETFMKVDIVRELNHHGEIIKENDVNINNLEDMGAMKIEAFEERAEIKDVIDLYYITKDISFERLFELADEKRIPVPYENLLQFNMLGISGKALLKKGIEDADFQAFVRELKSATELEVKKKEKIAKEKIPSLVKKLLWDYPKEDRNLTVSNKEVLKRRLFSIPFPERNVFSQELENL